MIDALFGGGQQYDTLARLRANYIRLVALFAIIVLSILMVLQLLNIVRFSESGPVENILSTGVFLALCGGLLLLVQRGLVRIAADENDRRIKRLALTPAGNAVLAKAYALWTEFHGAIEAEMKSPSADAMRSGLIRMVEKLERGNTV